MNILHRFERFAARAFWSGVIAGAMLAATSGTAAAAGLFDTATQADLRLAARALAEQGNARDRLVIRSVPGALRDRVVRVNAAELARLIPTGLDESSNRLDRARGLTGGVTLNLFPNVTVTADKVDIEAPTEGGYVWVGERGGDEQAFVTLVIHNGGIVGHIQAGGRIYSIDPIDGPVHRVIEIDQSKIKPDMHAPRPVLEKDAAPRARAPRPDPKVKTFIKVMVAHTINARNEMTGASIDAKKTKMQQRINLAISLTNQAFTRSGVLITFQRVGLANEISYNDVNSYGAGTARNYLGVLCDVGGPATAPACCDPDVTDTCQPFANQSNKFSALRSKRNAVAADLVALMRKGGLNCGIGWEPDIGNQLDGDASSEFHAYGYSVTTSSPSIPCIETHTFAHETGHNQSLNHDRRQHQLDYGGAIKPASWYNFGHVNRAKRFFSIMAYQSVCEEVPPVRTCTVAPYFSNPSKSFNAGFGPAPVGVPIGTPGPDGSAFDAKTLNDNRGEIAAYR